MEITNRAYGDAIVVAPTGRVDHANLGNADLFVGTDARRFWSVAVEADSSSSKTKKRTPGIRLPHGCRTRGVTNLADRIDGR